MEVLSIDHIKKKRERRKSKKRKSMKLEKLDVKKLAKMIDHTCLKPYATKQDLEKLCKEAKEVDTAMIAINTEWTRFCKELLKDTDVHVGAAISFPLGQEGLPVKLYETEYAISEGADEIDYVIHIGKAKMHDWAYLEDEMRQINDICKKHHVICKVIFETCYLSDDEIIELAKIASKVKPDFIKTSTGFGTAGATAHHVRLMKENAKEDVKVKAAGGIRDLKTALEMVEAGAERIGTSSTLKILEEASQDFKV